MRFFSRKYRSYELVKNINTSIDTNCIDNETATSDHFSNGLVAIISANYDDALMYFNLVRDVRGVSNVKIADSYYFSSFVLCQLNKFNEANQAIALAHLYWGMHEVILNQYCNAVEHFDSALNTQEISNEIKIDIYFKRGHAKHILGMLEESNEDTALGYIHYAVDQGNCGQYIKVIENVDKALSLKKISSRTKSKAYYNRGIANKNLMHNHNAVDDIRLAYLYLGLSLKEINKFDEALESLNYALNLKETSAKTTIRIYISISFVLYEQKKYDQAIQKFIATQKMIDEYDQCFDYIGMINIGIERCNKATKFSQSKNF